MAVVAALKRVGGCDLIQKQTVGGVGRGGGRTGVDISKPAFWVNCPNGMVGLIKVS